MHGKWLDGTSTVPWSKMILLDASCPDTLAPSYLAKAISGPGLVAASAEDRMRSKYSFLEHNHIFFIPVAMRPLVQVAPVSQLPGRPWPPSCTCHRRSGGLPVPVATVIYCHPKEKNNFYCRWNHCCN